MVFLQTNTPGFRHHAPTPPESAIPENRVVGVRLSTILLYKMSTGLNIRHEGSLDFLSLGALVHRLDPGIIPFRKATHCDIHVSGGEFNVAANLSDCFRLRTGIASAMVDYPIGDLIAERVRAMGVRHWYKHFKHDGVHGPNMATVYSDRGQGVRAPVVFYNRCNEAAAQIKPGDFN